eukprot:TRINITY_DN1944_c0_g1_i21.p2 TRINITY_DN1944_c0_g1~~TRINITY_DN1944_c0_g1_i21.p2  ORF type:complete len:191 (+),score=-12.66 TRINITY_DN1944_c0_g1_i21:560-1132(+)
MSRQNISKIQYSRKNQHVLCIPVNKIKQEILMLKMIVLSCTVCEFLGCFTLHVFSGSKLKDGLYTHIFFSQNEFLGIVCNFCRQFVVFVIQQEMIIYTHFFSKMNFLAKFVIFVDSLLFLQSNKRQFIKCELTQHRMQKISEQNCEHCSQEKNTQQKSYMQQQETTNINMLLCLNTNIKQNKIVNTQHSQ